MDNTIKELREQADAIISNCTAPINELIDMILQNTKVSPNGSTLGLSMDDLYALAIRIPSECAYLQTQLNSQLIQQKVQSFLTETKITESIVILQGSKGDARERQRRAKAMSKDDVLASIITEQIISSLQATIQRADKVYEGIKKIIDAKTREFNFDMKPGRSVGM